MKWLSQNTWSMRELKCVCVFVCLCVPLLWVWEQHVHKWQQNQWIKFTRLFFMLSLVCDGGKPTSQPISKQASEPAKKVIVYRCERCQFRWNNLCKWRKTHTHSLTAHQCWLLVSTAHAQNWFIHNAYYTWIFWSCLAQVWRFFSFSLSLKKTPIQYWQWHFVCVFFSSCVFCHPATKSSPTTNERMNTKKTNEKNQLEQIGPIEEDFHSLSFVFDIHVSFSLWFWFRLLSFFFSLWRLECDGSHFSPFKRTRVLRKCSRRIREPKQYWLSQFVWPIISKCER